MAGTVSITPTFGNEEESATGAVPLSITPTFGDNPFRAPEEQKPATEAPAATVVENGQNVEDSATATDAQKNSRAGMKRRRNTGPYYDPENVADPFGVLSRRTDGTAVSEQQDGASRVGTVFDSPEVQKESPAKVRVREYLKKIWFSQMEDAEADQLFTSLVTSVKFLGWGKIVANERGMFGEPLGSMTGMEKLKRLRDWANGDGSLINNEQAEWNELVKNNDVAAMDEIVKSKHMDAFSRSDDYNAAANYVNGIMAKDVGVIGKIHQRRQIMAFNDKENFNPLQKIDGEFMEFSKEDVAAYNAKIDELLPQGNANAAKARRDEYGKTLSMKNTIFALENIAGSMSDGSRAFVASTAVSGTFNRTSFDSLPDDEKMKVLALVKIRRGELDKGYNVIPLRGDDGKVIDWNRFVYGVARSISDLPEDVVRTVSDMGTVAATEIGALVKGFSDMEAAREYRRKSYDELSMTHQIRNAMTQEIPDASTFIGRSASGFGDNFGFLLISEVGGAGLKAATRGMAYASRAANIEKAKIMLDAAKASGVAEDIAKAEKVLAAASEGKGSGILLKPFEKIGAKIGQMEGNVGQMEAKLLKDAKDAYHTARKQVELIKSGTVEGDLEQAMAKLRQASAEYGKVAMSRPVAQTEAAVANGQLMNDIVATHQRIADYTKWLKRTGKAVELAGKGAEHALWYLPFYTRRLDRAAANGEPMEQAAHSAFVTMLWSGFWEKQAFTRAAKLGIGEVAMSRQSFKTMLDIIGKRIINKTASRRVKEAAAGDVAKIFLERQVTNIAHGLDTAFNVTAQSVADEWGVMLSEIWNEAKHNVDTGFREIEDWETGEKVQVQYGLEDFVKAFTPDRRWIDTCMQVVKDGAYPAIGFAILSGTNARFGHWRQSLGEARYLKGVMGEKAYQNYALKDRGVAKAYDDIVAAAQAAIDFNLQGTIDVATEADMEASLPDSTPAEKENANDAKENVVADVEAKMNETLGKVLEIALDETGAVDVETIMEKTGVDQSTAEILASMAQDYRALMVRDDARRFLTDLVEGRYVDGSGIRFNVRNAEYALRQFIRFAPNVENVVDNGDGVISVDVNLGNGRTVNVGLANNEGITNELIESSVNSPAIAAHWKKLHPRTPWSVLSIEEKRDFCRRVIEGNNRRVGSFFFTGSDGKKHFVPIDDLVTLTGKTNTRAVSHEVSHTIFRAAEEMGFIDLDAKCAIADAVGIDRTSADATAGTGEMIDGREKQKWEIAVDEAIAEGYSDYTNGRSMPALPRVMTGFDAIDKAGNWIIDTLFGGDQANADDATVLDDLYEAMFRGELESIRDITDPLLRGKPSLKTQREIAQKALKSARDAFDAADEASRPAAKKRLREAQKALHAINAQWDAQRRSDREARVRAEQSARDRFSLVEGSERDRLEKEFEGEDGTDYILSYLSKGDPKWGNKEWKAYIDTIDWSKCGDYVRTYRAMEVTDDGALIPPMASYVGTGAKDRKVNGAAHVGDIVKSDENPELRIKGGKDDGKFPLWKLALKKDKKTGRYKVDWSKVAAAYNPYIHSSFRPLNDQFSLAWSRPNLRTVEMLVPTSEFKDEVRYWAEHAKNSIGLHPWTSGNVTRQLTEFNRPARQVLMTKYGKINRVLSNEEVAQKIMEDFGDAADKISIPQEVFPPEVYKLLTEKYGVNGVAMEDAEAKMQAVDELMRGNGSRNSLISDVDQRTTRLAPNGKRSNLTDRQYDQVRTPEFKRWFGDWENDPENASNVVDENGEPLVMYSGAKFKWRGYEHALGYTIWMSPDRSIAEGYDGGDGVRAFFVRGKYREYNADGQPWNSIYDSYKDYEYALEHGEEELDYSPDTTDSLLESSKDEGYDGVYIRNVRDGYSSGDMGKPTDIIAVLSEKLTDDGWVRTNNVKSATDNVGTFDPENPDIRYSLATPEQNSEYNDAIAEGDDERAVEILREVASKAMPDTKVVDTDGKPKIVYHHTENRFTEFDLDKSRKSMDIQGFFFFDNPTSGDEYGSLNYGVFLNITNPYVIDSNEKMSALNWDGSKDGEGVRVRNELIAQGYDGVVRTKEFMGDSADEWIAFNPEQIKLAEPTYEDEYGESPVSLDDRFNFGSNDIRYSLSYGMPYQGSKGQVARDIIGVLPSGNRFVDLFAGGGAMTHAAMMHGSFGKFYMNDADARAINGFTKAISGQYRGYSAMPTREEFDAMKASDSPDVYLHSFLGNGINYMPDAGRTERNVRRANRIADDVGERAGDLTTNVGDYRSYVHKDGDVVYADIPYAGTDTRAYRGEKFDHRKFVEWASEQDYPVYVSSYEAPAGFTEIWSRDVSGLKGKKTERLFVQDKFADQESERIYADNIQSQQDFGNYSLILGENGALRLEENMSVLGNFLTAKNMLFEKAPYVTGEHGDVWKNLSRDDKLKIKLATGWEVGADGMWRKEDPFQLADSFGGKDEGTLSEMWKNVNDLYNEYSNIPDYKIDESDAAYEKYSKAYDAYVKAKFPKKKYTVGDFIRGSSVDKAYPQLGRIPVRIKKLRKGVGGHYDITKNEIYISRASTRSNAIKTLTHEIQHAIQHIEGFAQGGDNREGSYKNFAGEVEARNASRRTPDDIAKLLEDTEDVSRDVQIVRRLVSDAYSKIDESSRMSLRADQEIAIYIPDGHYEDGVKADFIGAILDGWKRGETRPHKNLPKHRWLGIVKNGMVHGRVMLGDPIEITNKSPEYAYAAIDGTEYGLKDGEKKWYYPIEDKMDFRDDPIPLDQNGNYGAYTLPENIIGENRFAPALDNEDGAGRMSLMSIAVAAGMEGRVEDGRWGGFYRNGEKVSHVTADDIMNSPIGRIIEFSVGRGTMTNEQANGIAELFASVTTTIAKTGDLGFGQQVFGSAIFTGIKTNSDKQYGTTYDFPSICTKTQAMIDAMSENMVRLGRGLSKDELLALYQHVFDLGAAVPCPECYVFSRWVGVGGMLDNLRKYQDRFGVETVENVRAMYESMKAEIEEEVRRWNEDPEHADKQIKFGKGKGKLAGKCTKEYNKFLDKVETARNKGDEVSEADVARLNFLESRMDTVKAMTWIEDVYFTDGSMKHRRENFRVPDNVLFDLNNAEEFATKYPQAWYWRCTQGAGYGKAITPYAEAVLGEGIQATGGSIGSMIKAKKNGKFDNRFLGETLTKKAAETLKSAIYNMRNQAFLGGQRFQSTSDARFENMTDYMVAHFEVQAMDGMVQLYTKVLSAVPFFASAGDSVNMSMMPDTRYGGLKDGVPVDTATGGADPVKAQELREKYPTAGTITIGVNDQHIRALVRQAWRDFVIPYHVSGGDARMVSQMRLIQEAYDKASEKLGIPNESKLSTDYTTTQGDKKLSDDMLAEIWGYTPEQIERVHKIREQRLAILTRGGSGKNKIAFDMDVIRSNKFLSRLYDRLNGGEWDGVCIQKGKVDGHIFPNEFFDTNVKSEEESKIWTIEYLEYCRDLGYLHRFSGMKIAGGHLVRAKGRSPDCKGPKDYVEMEDLFYKDGMCRNGIVDSDAVEPLMWKVLVDRRMLDNDGAYQAQKRVDMSNIDVGDAETFAKNQQGVRNYDTFVERNDHAKVEDLMSAKANEGRMAKAAGGNFSLMIPPEVSSSMTTEDLLAMAAAGRLARSAGGDAMKATEEGVRADLSRRLKALDPSATDNDVEVLMARAKADAGKAMKGIEGSASKDILAKLSQAQAERYYSSLKSAGRKGIAEGAKATRARERLDRRMASKVAEEIAAQTGIAVNELEASLGVDLAETMLHLQDIFPAATNRNAEGADESEEDSVQPDFDVEESTLTPEEKLARENAIREMCRQIMEKAWKADEELRRKIEERKAKRKAKAKNAEGSEQESEGDESEEPITSEDLAEFIVNKHAIDLRNPHQFAQFIKIMCEEKWKKDHGISADQYIWGDPVALANMRMTASGVYAALARKLMYSNRREGAFRTINEIENAPTIGALLNSMVDVGRTIAQGMVTEKRNDLVKDIERLLEQRFGAKGRFKQNEEDINRKVSGFTELWAREIKRWLWASEQKVADELQNTLTELSGVEAAFMLNNRDPNSSKNYNHNLLKMQVLQEFGGMSHKALGEIVDARGKILDRLANDTVGQEMEERERRTRTIADLIERAVDAGRTVSYDDKHGSSSSKTGKMLSNYFQSHLDFKHLLLDLARYCKSDQDRADYEAFVDDLQHTIQRNWDRAKTEQRNELIKFRNAVEEIYHKSYSEAMSELLSHDERFDRFGTMIERQIIEEQASDIDVMMAKKEGRPDPRKREKIRRVNVRMSRAQAMNLYVAMQQKGYVGNVEKNGREDQSAEIRKLLTPEDLRMIKWIGDWYDQNREALSEASKRIFGLPVEAEEANYFPVTPYRPTQGLNEMSSKAWSPFPPALTARVRHGYDFDVRKDIFSTWSEKMQEQAQWKNMVDLGVELRGIFGRQNVQSAIIDQHGKKAWDNCKAFINDILNGGAQVEGGLEFWDNVRGWTALAALGGNIGVMIKQTTSIPAFAFEIGWANMGRYLSSGLWAISAGAAGNAVGIHSEALAAMRDIWESDQRKNRWDSGNSDEVTNALRLMDSKPALLKTIFQKSMAFNKVGDVVPALLIGQGIYRSYLSQGLSKDEALNRTWEIINRTQQTGQVDNLTAFQRRSAFGRFVTQFQTTVRQYTAYEISAIRKFAAQPNGKNAAELASFTVLNAVCASMYFWGGALWQWILGRRPDEDSIKAWIQSMITSCWGSIFMLGSFAGIVSESLVTGGTRTTATAPSMALAGTVITDIAKIAGMSLADIAAACGYGDADYDLDDFLKAAEHAAKAISSPFRDADKIIRWRIKGEDPKGGGGRERSRKLKKWKAPL